MLELSGEVVEVGGLHEALVCLDGRALEEGGHGYGGGRVTRGVGMYWGPGGRDHGYAVVRF